MLFSVDQTGLSVSTALFHAMSAGASRAVDHTDTSTLMSIVVVRIFLIVLVIFLIVLVIFLIVLVIFLIIFLVSKEISKRFVAEREAGGGCDRRSLPTDHFDDPVAMVTSSGGDLRIFPMTVNSTLEMTGSAFIETKR